MGCHALHEYYKLACATFVVDLTHENDRTGGNCQVMGDIISAIRFWMNYFGT